MEDSHIMKLLFSRAERAITVMSNVYGPRLYRTAMHILGQHEDAEESVNDTYFAVWNSIPPKQPNPLSGFVYKTGRNIALNRLRHVRAQRRASDYDLSLDELAGCIVGATLDDEIEIRLLGREIDRFLDTLPKSSRILFLRRYWFGDSVKDIARSCCMTPNAVSVQLSRAREKLKDHLTKEGFL